MRKLATELLDLSRLESGALELRPEPTDVGQLAREIAGEFTPGGDGARGPPDRPGRTRPDRDRCDPERVAQVVRILLDNALVHTPQGTDSSFRRRRDDGHVTLEVADRGLGIRDQTMPHIFEPFYTSADGARGAGLGLAIARELAEQMRGELTVASRPARRRSSSSCPHEPRARRRPVALALAAGWSAAAASAATTSDDGRRLRRDDHARRGVEGTESDGGGFDAQRIYERRRRAS